MNCPPSHDLRHTTASLAVAAGADVKTLQTMLGHASAVMILDRYGHLMPGRGSVVLYSSSASRATRPLQ
jgi:integrase